MVSYTELIDKYQKENKKTVFDIERAVNDLIGNSVLNDFQVQQVRKDIANIFNEYVRLYKKHNYMKDRVEKHESNFMNRIFTFQANVSIYILVTMFMYVHRI